MTTPSSNNSILCLFTRINKDHARPEPYTHVFAAIAKYDKHGHFTFKPIDYDGTDVKEPLTCQTMDSALMFPISDESADRMLSNFEMMRQQPEKSAPYYYASKGIINERFEREGEPPLEFDGEETEAYPEELTARHKQPRSDDPVRYDRRGPRIGMNCVEYIRRLALDVGELDMESVHPEFKQYMRASRLREVIHQLGNQGHQSLVFGDPRAGGQVRHITLPGNVKAVTMQTKAENDIRLPFLFDAPVMRGVIHDLQYHSPAIKNRDVNQGLAL